MYKVGSNFNRIVMEVAEETGIIDEVLKEMAENKIDEVLKEMAENKIDDLIHDGKIETAKKMLAKGYKTSDIAEISGLTISEVKQLQRQQQPA